MQVPLSTYYRLPDAGGDVVLRIHTHVREDALSLYGFGTALEQQLFERLIGISGIGPRLALSVLSGIDPGDLVRAVQAGDVGRLTLIPGIGKKTAERIGLELKDRLPAQLQSESREVRRRRGGRAVAAGGRPLGAAQSGVSSRPRREGDRRGHARRGRGELRAHAQAGAEGTGRPLSGTADFWI